MSLTYASVANVKGSGLRKCDYDFAEDQTWCQTSHRLQFIDESSEVVADYETIEDPVDVDTITRVTRQPCPSSPRSFRNGADHTVGHDGRRTSVPSARSDPACSSPTGGRRTDSHDIVSHRSFESLHHRTNASVSSPGFAFVATPSSLDNIVYKSPAAQSAGTSELLHSLTETISHHSLDPGPSPLTSSLARIYQEGSLWPLQQKHEAVLMRHFVETLSISLDICDPERHFALVVPRRASICPTLLNAIFACSARHLSRTSDLDPHVSERYHQECLKYLIPMLNDGAAMMDENLLAATVILRFFEEAKGLWSM